MNPFKMKPLNINVLSKKYNQLEYTIATNKRFKNYIKIKNNKVYPNLRKDKTLRYLIELRFLRSKLLLYPVIIIFGIIFLISSQNRFLRESRSFVFRPIILLAGEILRSKELIEAGSELLTGLFKQQMFYNAVLELLISVMKNPKFMDETKEFGINLFGRILRDNDFQNELLNLTEKILRMPDMQKEGLEIFRYIIERKESKEVLANYFKAIFLRDDIFNGLSHLFLLAIINALDHPDSKTKFSQFLTKIWADNEFRWLIIKTSFNFWSSENKKE